MVGTLDDRTRISAAILSSVDGSVGLPYGKNAYSGFFAASQAFDVGKFGTDRVGFYAMVGEAPTTYLTTAAVPIPSSGVGNTGFNFSRQGRCVSSLPFYQACRVVIEGDGQQTFARLGGLSTDRARNHGAGPTLDSS